jgi:putative oxidoreductase
MSAAHKTSAIARVLLGTIFVVFGLNYFLHFIPLPPPRGDAATFMSALAGSGYLMELVHIIEVLGGIALLANRFVPLTLAILAPIIVNIAAFHARYAPSGLPLAILLVVLEFYLAWSYRRAFAPMLQAHVEPTVSLRVRTAGPAGSHA